MKYIYLIEACDLNEAIRIARRSRRPKGPNMPARGKGDASRASAAAAPGNGVKIESSP